MRCFCIVFIMFLAVNISSTGGQTQTLFVIQNDADMQNFSTPVTDFGGGVSCSSLTGSDGQQLLNVNSEMFTTICKKEEFGKRNFVKFVRKIKVYDKYLCCFERSQVCSNGQPPSLNTAGTVTRYCNATTPCPNKHDCLSQVGKPEWQNLDVCCLKPPSQGGATCKNTFSELLMDIPAGGTACSDKRGRCEVYSNGSKVQGVCGLRQAGDEQACCKITGGPKCPGGLRPYSYRVKDDGTNKLYDWIATNIADFSTFAQECNPTKLRLPGNASDVIYKQDEADPSKALCCPKVRLAKNVVYGYLKNRPTSTTSCTVDADCKDKKLFCATVVNAADETDVGTEKMCFEHLKCPRTKNPDIYPVLSTLNKEVVMCNRAADCPAAHLCVHGSYDEGLLSQDMGLCCPQAEYNDLCVVPDHLKPSIKKPYGVFVDIKEQTGCQDPMQKWVAVNATGVSTPLQGCCSFGDGDVVLAEAKAVCNLFKKGSQPQVLTNGLPHTCTANKDYAIARQVCGAPGGYCYAKTPADVAIPNKAFCCKDNVCDNDPANTPLEPLPKCGEPNCFWDQIKYAKKDRCQDDGSGNMRCCPPRTMKDAQGNFRWMDADVPTEFATQRVYPEKSCTDSSECGGFGRYCYRDKVGDANGRCYFAGRGPKYDLQRRCMTDADCAGGSMLVPYACVVYSNPGSNGVCQSFHVVVAWKAPEVNRGLLAAVIGLTVLGLISAILACVFFLKYRSRHLCDRPKKFKKDKKKKGGDTTTGNSTEGTTGGESTGG